MEKEAEVRASRYRAVMVLAAILALAGAACGGGGDEEPVTGSAVGPGISIEEALAFDGEQPLLVNGVIVASGEEVRLCSALAESFPPQCGEPSLIVEGLDLDSLTGLSSEGAVTWSEEQVQLVGSVSDATLTVDEQAQA